MALSGKYRSPIYRLDKLTAARMALSVMRILWWASYRSRNPSRMRMASSSVGSPTMTDWNLRSSAASFSIYFRYSFTVVAPTTCNSPLDNKGFRMFAASIAPSAAPAPTRVWISSMNNMIFPLASTSSTKSFKRSSNSPRYLAPAIMADKSMVTTCLSSMVSGTSPAAIFCASPSAMAVFPTPGSPIRQGLFLVRRERICTTRISSVSRPITGSLFPSLARVVKSRPYFSRLPSFLGLRSGLSLPAAEENNPCIS